MEAKSKSEEKRKGKGSRELACAWTTREKKRKWKEKGATSRTEKRNQVKVVLGISRAKPTPGDRRLIIWPTHERHRLREINS